MCTLTSAVYISETWRMIVFDRIILDSQESGGNRLEQKQAAVEFVQPGTLLIREGI